MTKRASQSALRCREPASRCRYNEEFFIYWAGRKLGRAFGCDGVVIVAYDARGNQIGKFKTLSEARLAIYAASRRANVAAPSQETAPKCGPVPAATAFAEA